MTDTLYEPRIDKLLDKKFDDWGDPEENQRSILSYGIRHLDEQLFGIDYKEGELILLSGQQKRRKTTFLLNVLVNMFTSPIPEQKMPVVMDVLESGMTSSKYRDHLIAIVASRLLIQAGHTPHNCRECGGQPTCKELKLNPGFFRYVPRSKTQRTVINRADEIMRSWPLYIFDAGRKTGNTRNIEESITGGKIPQDAWHVRYGKKFGVADEKELRLMSRWQFMEAMTGAVIYGVDHLQQYLIGGRRLTDYEMQLAVVPIASQWVVEDIKHVVFLLSQISLTSARDARQNMGRPTAAGGNTAGAEANVAFSTQYDPDHKKDEMWVVVEESRKSPSFSVKTYIEPISGTFFGETEISHKREFIG